MTTQKDLTLVAVSSIKIRETVAAMRVSLRGMKYARALLISHEKPEWLAEDDEISFATCPKIQSIDEYSRFVAYELAKYIDTEFALVVQYDGFVLRPEKWSDEFFAYDYIGAPWKPGVHFTKSGKEVRVGNGGFSLRSKKLLNALNELNLPMTDGGTGVFNEDGMICNYYRKELEAYGIKFAPVEIASRFSREGNCPDSFPEPFGFHKDKTLIPFWVRARLFLFSFLSFFHLKLNP